MSTSILNQLQELRPHSNKQLLGNIDISFKEILSNSMINPIQLVKPKQIASMDWSSEPKEGSQSLLQAKNRQAMRKVMSLSPSTDTNFTYVLNSALLGGRSYPILTAIIGTATGLASFSLGLFFTVASTGLSMSQKSQRVLARGGDEIWQIEEIGKTRVDGKFKAMHINSYFLVDPFRKQNALKGWLIHEERTEIIL